MRKYTLLYSPEAKESIEAFPAKKLKRIAERVLLNISENPFLGKKLLGKLLGLYSARITRRYRVIYQIDTTKRMVWVITVVHRKEAYR